MDQLPISILMSLLLFSISIIIYIILRKSMIYEKKKGTNPIILKTKKVKDWILIIGLLFCSLISFLHFINR